MKKQCFSIGLFLVVATISAYAQTSLKELILNKDLKIEKLIVKNEDISYTLGSVSISEQFWHEFDRDGKEIGKASVQEFTDSKIRIKWIFSDNGADVGDVTIYSYEKSDGKMIFNIHYDDEEQGFFEAML